MRYPEHILLADDHSRMAIYGKSTDKVVNTSSKGFTSDFFIGFIVGISSLIVLSMLLPTILYTLNVDSFVFCIGDSHFIAFGYSGGEEGFGFSISPLPMLLFGGIIGLIYGLARSDKPAAKPERSIDRLV